MKTFYMSILFTGIVLFYVTAQQPPVMFTVNNSGTKSTEKVLKSTGNDLIDSVLYYTRKNCWEPYARCVNEFTGGNISETDSFVWNNDSARFLLKKRTTYNYDDQSILTQKAEETLFPSFDRNTWEYQYDGNGNQVIADYTDTIAPGIFVTARDSTIFDENLKVYRFSLVKHNNVPDQDTLYYRWEYNIAGRLTGEYTGWRVDGEYSKKEYNYQEDDLVKTTAYNWDAADSNWTAASKDTFIYDQGHHVIRSEHFEVRNSSWMLFNGHEYEYDNQGNMVKASDLYHPYGDTCLVPYIQTINNTEENGLTVEETVYKLNYYSWQLSMKKIISYRENFGLCADMDDLCSPLVYTVSLGYDTCEAVIPETGVEEMRDDPLLHIYPNPNNGKFEITFKEINGTCSISIYSLSGKEVFSREIDAGSSGFSLPVNLENVDPGIYVVQVCSDRFSNRCKIIINRK